MVRQALWLVPLFLGWTARGGADEASPRLVDQLTGVVQEIYDAVISGERATWERVLADSFVLVDRDGAMKSKLELLPELRPLPQSISLQLGIAEAKARDLGQTAILTYLTREVEVIWGQTLHVDYRNMMVFGRRQGVWQLEAWQYVEIPKDGTPVRVDPSIYDQYVGTYEAAPEVRYVVTHRDGRLFGQRAGRPEAELVPEGEGVFYTPQSEFRKLFVKDDNGHVMGFLDRRKGSDTFWRRVE